MPTFSLRSALFFVALACVVLAVCRLPSGALWIVSTNEIYRGMTKAEVEHLIGPPTVHGKRFASETLWTYRAGMFGYYYFMITFDAGGQVVETRLETWRSFDVVRRLEEDR